MALGTNYIRLKLIQPSIEQAPLSLTAWKGNATNIEVAIYESTAVSVLTNVESITFRVKVDKLDDESDVLIEETVTSFDGTLTDATWLDGTKQHFTIELTNDQLSQDLLGKDSRSFYGVFVAILTSGSEVTLGAGNFTIFEDNSQAGDLAPPTVGSGISVDQADARYLNLSDARLTDERVPTSAGLISKFSTNKATIVDADKVAIFDSAASDAPKHSLFSLIKSTLKTYFDSLYPTISAMNLADDALTIAISDEASTRSSADNALGNAIALKQNLLTGVIVTKANGTRTAYTPSADTDTARGVALEAAFSAAVAGDTIDLSSGNYYVAKAVTTIMGYPSQFGILDGMTIRLNGARLYKKSTDTASSMFTTNGTSLIDDWYIGGGLIDGSYAANSDTAARGASANEIGINIKAVRRGRIENVTLKNLAGTGIQGDTATFVSDEYGGSVAKYSTMHIHGCNVDLNNIGLSAYAGNEYWSVTNSTFNKNLTGLDIYAGNMKFSCCEANGNTNFAMRIRNGGNDGHGCWIGGMMNHNAGFAISVESSMDLGFAFSGSHFFADSNTTNKIQSLGGGINLTGCIIDAPIYASATPTGLNTIKSSFISGTYTTITDLSSAERAKWRFQNNHTLTSVWSSDDIRTTYANDAAAGTGGVLQGEIWQQVTTGAVFVKL